MNKNQVALAFLLLVPSWSYAASISDLNAGQAAYYDKTQRNELAKKLDQLFRSLNDAVPSLKPSERKWVNDERRAI